MLFRGIYAAFPSKYRIYVSCLHHGMPLIALGWSQIGWLLIQLPRWPSSRIRDSQVIRRFGRRDLWFVYPQGTWIGRSRLSGSCNRHSRASLFSSAVSYTVVDVFIEVVVVVPWVQVLDPYFVFCLHVLARWGCSAITSKILPPMTFIPFRL